jgi:hypothetical protein
VQQTGCHAIEEVEDGTNHDEQQCHLVVRLECPKGSDAPRDEVATGNRIGDMLFHDDQ